jgi:type 1 fimbria pilin
MMPGDELASAYSGMVTIECTGSPQGTEQLQFMAAPSVDSHASGWVMENDYVFNELNRSEVGLHVTDMDTGAVLSCSLVTPCQVKEASVGTHNFHYRVRYVYTGRPMVGSPLVVRLVRNGVATDILSARATINKPLLTTCSLENPPTLILEDVLPTDLATAGAAAKEKPFQVTMKCVASRGDGGARIQLVLHDAANAGNVSDTLDPAPGSEASGVGLQVLRDGIPIQLGSPWRWGTALGTATHNIDLGARYVRTNAPVYPGKIKGLATLVLSYN